MKNVPLGTVCLLYSHPPISWAQNTALTWLSKHLLFANLSTITASKRLKTCFAKLINKQKKRDLKFFSKISACNFLFKYFCFPLRVEAIFPCGHFFFSTHTAVSEGIFRLSCHQHFLLNTSRKLKGEELKTEEI